MFGKKIVGTNDPAIVEIFAKEGEYFTKKIGESSLSEIKPFGGQGLFTTDTDEMDWKLAHKLLMPAFSPRAIKVIYTFSIYLIWLFIDLFVGISKRNGSHYSRNYQDL